MNDDTMVEPAEMMLDGIRRALKRIREDADVQRADDDGSLREVDAVLRLKRGCRR